MIRRYPWHIAFAFLVILSLANIFQKLRWSTATDHISWMESDKGMVCSTVPAGSDIQPGDILLAVNGYTVSNRVDFLRIIEQKNYCYYKVERQGVIHDFGIDIGRRFTSFSYYLFVFCGIILILLTLGILNMLQQRPLASPPPVVFYLLSLSLAGFLLFSPVGKYNTADFFYLALDRIAYLFFPSLLLHYSLLYPRRSQYLRRLSPRNRLSLFYLAPLAVLAFFFYFLLSNLGSADGELLKTILTHFNRISLYIFSFYLLLALISFLVNNLNLIFRKKLKRFLLPLSGIFVSILALSLLNFFPPSLSEKIPWLVNSLAFLIAILPFSLVYLMSQRRFTDIEILIRKTFSTSMIFVFVFGIYLFLGLNIEQNKILGVFWSIAAILMAGLLFKPIEGTIQRFVEKLFYREAFNFKRNLKELESTIITQRDLTSLASGFLDVINKGFQLPNSALIIHYGNNIFYSLPDRSRLFLSQDFRRALTNQTQLVFLSDQEFKIKFPKDHLLFNQKKYYQFLPLRVREKLVGMVAFGRKRDQTYLSVEDWELMYGIASSLALSVENAFLYSRLENQLQEMNLLTQFNEGVIENINIGIVVLSSQNRIKIWNRFMEDRFNVKMDRALNKPAQLILGEAVWNRIRKLKGDFAAARNVKIVIEEEERILDISVSPLDSGNQLSPNRIVMIEDVTERVAIQNQLIMSEKMASLGLLSAGIAHEINTPLTGISSYCQLILSNPDDMKGSLDMIEKIKDQVLRANKIVRTLLDFSRKKSEKPVEVNLNHVLDESQSLIEHKLKKKNISFKREYLFETTFNGYPTHLQQLFINLLINAIDAVDQNGLISISGSEDDQNVYIRIKDNGRGIKEKDLQKIFDPFFTTKDVGKGTGLGLSIVYNIVKEHFGDIKINSRLHRGTTCLISFPRETPLRSMKI